MPKPKRKPRTKADNDSKTRITVELIRNSAKIIVVDNLPKPIGMSSDSLFIESPFACQATKVGLILPGLNFPATDG